MERAAQWEIEILGDALPPHPPERGIPRRVPFGWIDAGQAIADASGEQSETAMPLRNSQLQQEATELGLEGDFSRTGGGGLADELVVEVGATLLGSTAGAAPGMSQLGRVCQSPGKPVTSLGNLPGR